MATVAAFPVDIENVKPQDNVPQLSAPVALKPSEAPKLEEPVQQVEQEAEDEDKDDAEFVDDEDEDEDEDEEIEQEEEEIYPEDELSTEVDAPFAQEVEAKEAIELAKAIGLDNPDSALERLGHQEKRVSSTISKYADLISASEKEVVQFYDGLTTEINNLRASVDEGIAKIATEAEIKITSGAVEVVRSLMEQYLRTVVERSVVHAEYREANQVQVNDILTVLSILGRPLYWKGIIEEAAPIEQSLDEAEDEDAMDEVEEEFSEEEEEVEMEQPEAGTEETDDDDCLNVAAFKRLVDVMNHWDVEMANESYACLQATTEDFLASIMQASSRSAHFAGRAEVTEDDVRFAQLMAQNKW